ncbi:MAG TPA: SDR family oxidoreductase [Pyrinomonadaceae bacterium]|nr:SDR family oxidoreductase [Pyrinomonadaceae bacterium]
MTPKRILILGGSGMLGHKLVQVLGGRFDTYCTIRGTTAEVEHYGFYERGRILESVDALNFSSVRSAIDKIRPDVVINAIGIIKQLPSSKDVIQTLTVNSIFPHLVADLAKELGFRFIMLSTDCVFSGDKGNYSEDDVPDSTDLYGRSKQFGEVAGTNCLTIRTSIVGRELGTSHSLIDWFLSQADRVNGYSNAIFSGFPTIVLADLLGNIIEEQPDLTGLFHVSSDPISKYALLELVKNRLGLKIEIVDAPEFRIDRSLDSSAFRSSTGFEPLPWAEMVDRMFDDPTPYDEWRKPASI